MPRPVRCRRIGQMPAFRSFSPDDISDAEVIRLTLDEYETLRLMDAEGLNQEACAAQMNVARTTVTAIYESARHKIATALVQGKRLQITGGCCEFAPVPPPEHLMMKGSQNMRIAIPYEQGEIPVLGGGLTSIGETTPTQQELVDLIIESYRLFARKIKNPQKLRIICKRKDDISLSKIGESI